MKNKNNSKSSPATQAAAARASGSPASLVAFWLGLLFMLVAATASLLMVIRHFDLVGLPGCGVDSGCDRAAKSVWGSVPGLKLPTSSIGLAYFLAVAVAWIAARGSLDGLAKWMIRGGVAVSVFYLALIGVEKFFCPYCLAAHAGNLAFWVVMESVAAAPRSGRRFSTALVSGVAAFAISVGILGAVEWQHRQAIAKKAGAELAQTTQQIIQQTNTASNAGTSEAAPGLHSPPGGFTGRWRMGPENAPIRVVIFSDYQCKDCNAIEYQVRDILATRSDVSVSAKHFPLNADCNRHTTRTIHPNACWAARAAETAGIIGGNEAFWKMHHWLFDKGGSFTNAELNAGLRELGFDQQRFVSIMNSDAAVAPVRADVDEGFALGLFFTPMIFINGVELRGFYNDPKALGNAITAVAASNPPPGSPTQDRPPLAAGKAVGDWREGVARPLPPKNTERATGPADAPFQIFVWGDYQNSHSQELDQYIRSVMKSRSDIRYIYRHYPMDQSCNINMQQTFSSAGCWAARAAEAAGSIGGNDAFWRMHDWLYANQTKFNDAALRAAAPELGLDVETIIAAMNSPAVLNLVSLDIATGKVMIPQGVPTIYVNSKWVARWKLRELNILEMILNEPAK